MNPFELYRRLKHYPLLVIENVALKQELEVMKQSDKVVIIEPTVNITGLTKLKKPLFIKGDNVVVKNMEMHSTRCDSLLTLMGNNAEVTYSNFVNHSPNGRVKALINWRQHNEP